MVEQFQRLMYSLWLFRRRIIKDKTEILFEWDKPREIIEYEAKMLRLRYRRIFPLIIFIALLLEALLLIPIILILQKCGPEHAQLIPSFAENFFLAWLFAAICLPLFIYVFEPLFQKWRKVRFQITHDAFVIKTDRVRKLPWDKISFFWVTSHESLDYDMLNFFHRKMKVSYPLPDSELSNEIISFVSSAVSSEKDDVLIKDIAIPFKQKLFLLSLTGLHAILILAGLYRFKNVSIPEYLGVLIFFILLYGTIFLGPGTVGMTFFYRSLFRKRKDLQEHAVKYNLEAIFLVGFVSLLYALLRIYSTITNAL